MMLKYQLPASNAALTTTTTTTTHAFLRAQRTSHTQSPKVALAPTPTFFARVAGQLQELLLQAEYDDLARNLFADFLHQHILPAIEDAQEGPVWRWPSFMTDDHVPVEIGLAWKSGATLPQVRFSIEAIGAQEIATRGTNIQASDRLARGLAESGLLDWDAYLHLRNHFVHQPSRGRSQIFFGFDLCRGGDVEVKVYFVLSSADSLSSFNSSELGRMQTDCESVAQLQQYINDLDDEERGRPVLIAFDLSQDLLASRCKLYWRFPTYDLGRVAQHAVNGLPVETKVDACPESFSAVISQALSCDGPQPDSHPTGGSLLYFDLSSGKGSKARTKMYLPVRHLAGNPAGRAAVVRQVFGLCNDEYVGASIAKAVDTLWTDVTYLCVEVDQRGRRGVCIYFKPRLL